MTKKDFNKLAKAIKEGGFNKIETCQVASVIGDALADDNPRFNWKTWQKATGCDTRMVALGERRRT